MSWYLWSNSYICSFIFYWKKQKIQGEMKSKNKCISKKKQETTDHPRVYWCPDPGLGRERAGASGISGIHTGHRAHTHNWVTWWAVDKPVIWASALGRFWIQPFLGWWLLFPLTVFVILFIIFPHQITMDINKKKIKLNNLFIKVWCVISDL